MTGGRDIMDGRLGRGMATGMWDMPRHDEACRAMMRRAEGYRERDAQVQWWCYCGG